jgi:hypothetical protein
MTVGETIEFDAPAPGGGTVKKSGNIIELLPNGRMRVEISVGGDTTTMLIDPNRQPKAPKPKREPKKKEPSLDLFNSAMQEMKQEIEELKAKVSPPAPADSGLELLEVNNDTILRPDYIRYDAETVLGSPLPTHRVFGRPEIHGDRHYLYGVPNPDRESNRQWLIKKPLPGVTSVLKKTMPTPPSLIKWMASFPGGYEAAREYTEVAAAKGTIMHGIFADFVNGLIPEFDSIEWHEYIALKIRKQRADKKYHGEWQHFMKKAILSLMQWIEDYEVTILLMEVALVSEELGYAGQLDVVCQMNDRIYTKPVVEVFPVKKPKTDRPKRQTKALAAAHEARHWEVEATKVSEEPRRYSPGPMPDLETRREPNMENIKDLYVFNPRRRVNALVDFKSGEHNSDSHAVQLSMYVPLFQEHFPNFKIDQVWNWHPTDWRENPGKGKSVSFSYKAINQSGLLSLEKVKHLLALYNMDAREEVGNVMQFVGKPELGVKPGELIKSVDFVEHWESTLHLALDLGLDIS